MIRNLKTQQIDFGRLQPKKIEINGVEVKPNENGQFTEYYFVDSDNKVQWKTNTRIRMAPQLGSPGSAGSVGGATQAITRINLIDPHIVQMMRDVMSNVDEPKPLNVAGAAGSGGGGGGVSGTGESSPTAGSAVAAADTVRCVVTTTPAGGGNGSNGNGFEPGGGGGPDVYTGGAGGGGAGGNGGAIIIITTSDQSSVGTLNTTQPNDTAGDPSSNGNISIMGGKGGAGGLGKSSGDAQTSPGGDGEGGHNGKYIFIQV